MASAYPECPTAEKTVNNFVNIAAAVPSATPRRANDGQRSAVVVGAGVAGLSAAYRLQQAGFAVTVIEKNAFPGGRVRTVRHGDFLIDTGPDAMTAGYVNFQALAREVGLGDQFVPSSRVVGLVRDGRLVDIDLGSPFAALSSPALSLRGKLQLASGLVKIRHMMKGIDSFRLVDSAELDDPVENAELFGKRIFGKEVTDYVVDPLMRLVAGSGALQCSRLGVLGGFANWSAPLINLKGGLARLPIAVAERLNVIYQAEAIRVSENRDATVVEYRGRDGNHHGLTSDVCVIATTHDVAEAIFPELATRVPGYGSSLRFIPMLSVSMGYAAPTRSRAYVVEVPTVENRAISLMFLQHNKAPDRVPSGHSLLTFYTDTIVADEYFPMSDDAVVAWARKQIEPLFPEFAGKFLFCHITRWPIVGYLATPGFWLRTRKLLQACTNHGRVQIAGDLFGAGSMESGITWGAAAAGQLIRRRQGVERLA